MSGGCPFRFQQQLWTTSCVQEIYATCSPHRGSPTPNEKKVSHSFLEYESKARRQLKGKMFLVDITRKNDHPYTPDRESKVYSVDGVKAKTLHVVRGHKYMFHITQHADEIGRYNHELYFTESPIGGEGKTHNNTLNTKSVCDGPLMLDVTHNLPDYFYYQDRNRKYMGGLIVVHSLQEYNRLSNSED